MWPEPYKLIKDYRVSNYKKLCALTDYLYSATNEMEARQDKKII